MDDREPKRLLVTQKVAFTSGTVWTFQDEETIKIVTDKVFSISLVTDCIFKYFSNSDLLSNCSSVSKLWNSTVKEYLHRCRKCFFVCNLSDLGKLKEIINSLKNRLLNSCLPFSGMKLVVTPSITTLLTNDIERLKSILLEIILQIDMTSVRMRSEEDPAGCVKWRDFCWNDRREYFNLLFSQVVFPILSTSKIQHLRFVHSHGMFNRYWKTWLENVETGKFSTLETIKPYMTDTTNCREDFEALLRTCPKIKKMPMNVTFDDIMTFEKYNRIDLVKRLVLRAGTTFNFNTDKFNALAKINNNLTRVELKNCCGWTPEQYQSIGMIVQLHSQSIRKIFLTIRDPNAVSSSYENICQINFPPLLFVKSVRIEYFSQTFPQEENDVKFKMHPHLMRIFPNAEIMPLRRSYRVGNLFLNIKA